MWCQRPLPAAALAIQLKSLNTDLQSVPTPSEIGPYVPNLERGIINNSDTVPRNSTSSITVPIGNNPNLPQATITFQGGMNNPKYKQLATDLSNDPDVAVQIYLQMQQGKTRDQAIAAVLAAIPKAQQIAVQDVLSDDPNNIVGPSGYGASGYVQLGEALPYMIEFTNDPTATAPRRQWSLPISLARTLTGIPSSSARLNSARL